MLSHIEKVLRRKYGKIKTPKVIAFGVLMVPVAGLSHRFSRLNAYMSKLIPAKIRYASHIVKALRRLTSKKETSETNVSDVSLVPVAGLEPARYRYRWILSPLRLPIPSHRHIYLTVIL